MPFDPQVELAALAGRSILLTGADGMLGRAFVEALAPLGGAVRLHAFPHRQLDVTDAGAVMGAARCRPDVVLHCAGMSLADRCERNPERARLVHVVGTANVARLARATGARVFYPQSVLVFDGRELPVTEATPPAPGLVYGRVKLEAEQLLLDSVPGSLVVRMAGFFGGDDKDKNFVGQFARTLATLLSGDRRSYEVGDRVWQPTYTLDHARNVLLLLALGREGIYHMGSFGEATFREVARAVVEELGLAEQIEIRPRPAQSFELHEAAARPRRLVTASQRLDREGLNRQRPWREALAEYLARPFFRELRRPGRTVHA